ncbi:hypothetical protein BpHYR1_028385 [Brachionus plicatilis]|uniref:Uncharacterized protein n=1 Tax=Brachionus plicatilis TaxID=10195 RepID=A0A3M7RN57_BRAPC|nr:hypothetical protein BpHYR1_028385 [Brachionus plicatilis]
MLHYFHKSRCEKQLRKKIQAKYQNSARRGTFIAESNLFSNQTGSKTCLHSTSTRRYKETDVKNKSYP